jgi:hypothetical protein
MSGYKPNYPDAHTDFDSIEAAVMETERGRAFLHEYAKRNRHADTQVLLTSLSRIEKSIEMRQEPSGVDQFRGDLLEMASAIEKTRKEISAMHSEQASNNSLVLASGELDSIVNETENATSNILAAAEKIQETAFTMRETGANATLCDLLDEQATLIYTASSFQDLTAQRTRKVIDALGFLEKRILAMVDIWAFAPKLDEEEPQSLFQSNSSPRRNVMSQADVDFVLVENYDRKPQSDDIAVQQITHENIAGDDHALTRASDTNEALEETLSRNDGDAFNELDVDEMLFSREAALATVQSVELPVPREALRIVRNDPKIDETFAQIKAGKVLTATEAGQALDALKAMSVEDRTRLFS